RPGPLVRAFVDPAYLASRTAPLMALPLWLRFFIAVTSGFVEETLYRGYAIERLAALTGRRWFSGIACAVIFGLAHIPAWGVAFALTADLPFGVLTTVFYLWRRDLLANGVVHSGGLVIALCLGEGDARASIGACPSHVMSRPRRTTPCCSSAP